MSEINELMEKIRQFRDERDWMQFHDHKNMAISIIIEAAELLEHFQWKEKKDLDEYVKQNRKEIEEEIADIAIYLFELADNLKLDLSKSILRKLEINCKKYPAHKAKGSAKKYNKL